MDIPARRIPVNLLTATPISLTVDAVIGLLTNIGLTCSDADKDKIISYIADLKASVNAGQINQVF